MGKPSATEPWGWQLDGHHAIINYFVLGDQVVMTPHFLGSEPVRATSGKYKDLVILQQEQNDGLKMLQALPEAQRRKATLTFSKTGNDNLAEAFKDNLVLDYAGLCASDLAIPARRQLVDLVYLYISNMDDGHARVKMNEANRHIDNTWFAWIGGTDPASAFYYRVHSPVILIEFDHQRPANLAKFSPDPNKPTQQHIHCVVRTPNGNDYGKDLLRQHYLAHPHDTSDLSYMGGRNYGPATLARPVRSRGGASIWVLMYATHGALLNDGTGQDPACQDRHLYGLNHLHYLMRRHAAVTKAGGTQ
jgi:hypothetical protein